MRHSSNYKVYRAWMLGNAKIDKETIAGLYKMGCLERKDIELVREYAKGKLVGIWLAGTMTAEEKHVFEKYIERTYNRMIDIYIA